MSSGGRLTVLLCAGALLLTACGGDGNKFAYLFGEQGATGGEQPQAEAPYVPDYPVADYEKENIPVLQALRQIDPCAMLDLEVIKKISEGPELNSIAPGDLLNECTVSVGQNDLKETWSFEVIAGVPVGADGAEDIAGVQFTKFSSRPTSCNYTTPMSKTFGLALQTTWHGLSSEQPPKPSCDVAKQYLTDTIARWKTPPKRSEHKTTPALPLATIDPCIAAKTLLGTGEGHVRISAPYRCSVQPKQGDRPDKTAPSQNIDVSLLFGNDPVQQIPVNPTSFKPAQIKGKPAAVSQSRSSCRITVQYSADTMVKVDEAKGQEPARTQVIEVNAGTCEAANAAAETVVGRMLEVKVPPARQPAPGAVKLGDLNPPKSWQEVGAPADPCTVIGWEAFPPEARDSKGLKPTRRPPEKDSVFKAACRFEAGGAELTVDKDKGATSKLSVMIALIVWGDDASGMSADPAKRKGSVAKEYSGKPGLEEGGTSSNGDPECLGIVQTSKGYWGISVTNAAFPNVQPCAISNSVLTAIAAKM
ncbi:hypothetical protein LWC34_56400 [Kibdelosporangium philippinense]|uniref:DUF3558 domain-containing protein n=1 Tax=Kibdelosporangium philippinense TaxID=211113 RepID=A0ABS8ZWS9_9PSEU|nr:hypothetical protein [Kibdelosporangium philippinense]MCE7012137.1 hypothetical protein [Kibdelosporangium philippinense]